ncbi:MAG: gluconate transporter, partial [Gammaproteobacteria bacterium]|nr:gluconate transporter [Gammaproteobacteria bacterium]
MGRFDEWLDDTRPVTVAPVTGIGDTIGMLMSHGNISPYIMAWLITVLIRLAT